jgi:hypothetical protein
VLALRLDHRAEIQVPRRLHCSVTTRAVQSNFRGTAFPESISNRWQVAGSLQFDARAQFDDPIGRETEELGSVGRIVLHPGKKPAEQWIQSASPRTKGTTDEAVKARREFS